MPATVDTPASVRMERGRKRATGLGRQEGGLRENPRVEDSTLESRAKKSPRVGASLWGEWQRLGLEGQRYWLTGV